MLQIPHCPFSSLQKDLLVVQPSLQWSSLLPIISPTATKDNLSLCVTAPLYIFEDHCRVTLTALLNGRPLAKRATYFWKHSAPDGTQHPAQLHRPKRGEGLLNMSCKGHSSLYTLVQRLLFFTIVWHCCLVFGLRAISHTPRSFPAELLSSWVSPLILWLHCGLLQINLACMLFHIISAVCANNFEF